MAFFGVIFLISGVFMDWSLGKNWLNFTWASVWPLIQSIIVKNKTLRFKTTKCVYKQWSCKKLRPYICSFQGDSTIFCSLQGDSTIFVNKSLPCYPFHFLIFLLFVQVVPEYDKTSSYSCPCYVSRLNEDEPVLNIDVEQKDVPQFRWALRGLCCTLRPF